jgi:hypothetical protein
MACPEKISIVAGRWNEITEQLISKALADATIDDIKQQTDAQLFVVQDEDAETLAAFVLRIDRQVTKNVGVVVAAGSIGGDLKLTAVVLPFIENMFAGCQSMRIHTEKIGLARMLSRQGYKVGELVLTKDLHHG